MITLVFNNTVLEEGLIDGIIKSFTKPFEQANQPVLKTTIFLDGWVYSKPQVGKK